MNKIAWGEIEYIYTLPGVDPKAIEQFKALKMSQSSHSREEGNLDHYCSFFLPYDKKSGKIYLGDHIKAEGWIPPGGHIEPGELPSAAAIREMQEELQVEITKDMIEPFNLSVTIVNRSEKGCMTHYDIWHLVHIDEQIFNFDRGEYYDAAWFTLSEGVVKMEKHPHFAAIVSKLR
jgi:8-oxo-dGTP diphosphatase